MCLGEIIFIKAIFFTLPLSLPLFLPRHYKISKEPPEHSSTIVWLLHRRLRGQGQETVGWNLWNHELRLIFSFFLVVVISLTFSSWESLQPIIFPYLKAIFSETERQVRKGCGLTYISQHSPGEQCSLSWILRMWIFSGPRHEENTSMQYPSSSEELASLPFIAEVKGNHILFAPYSFPESHADGSTPLFRA